MSRAGATRNLTATEELEKLEQSITLTLQEIDHNFSKAHRIVTTSILPLVEQYGEHSKSVWESSKFWKQFFEASANVSLSGYEELADEGETTQAEETTVEETTTDYTATQEDATADQSAYHEQQQQHHDQEGDIMEDSQFEMDGEMSGSTPRPPASKSLKPRFADLGSPYENLRRQLKDNDDTVDSTQMLDGDEDETMELPPHGASDGGLPNMSTTPRSSSMLEEPMLQQPSTAKKYNNKDVLLHRVLDKNYRIQATPLKSAQQNISPDKGAGQKRQALVTDSPMSSPEIAMPKLRSDLYTMSPVKSRKLGGGGPPRTPGVSVQTPGSNRKKQKDVFASSIDTKGKGKASQVLDEITWESDSDEDTNQVFGGMSPPKTIQFALPQSKLMQTPAREASRRIVDDILIRAGAAPDDDAESPSMVKMDHNIEDDTF